MTKMIKLNVERFTEMLASNAYTDTIRYKETVNNSRYTKSECDAKNADNDEYWRTTNGLYNTYSLGAEVVNAQGNSTKDLFQNVVETILSNPDKYEVVSNDEADLIVFFKKMMSSYKLQTRNYSKTVDIDDAQHEVNEDEASTLDYIEYLDDTDKDIVNAFIDNKDKTAAADELNINRRTYSRKLDKALGKLRMMIERDR